MKFSSSGKPNKQVLVLDASVLINLMGTGHADQFLISLGAECFIEELALAEVTRHPITSREVAPEIESLIAEKLITRVAMGDRAFQLFKELTSKSSSDSLDDGESATLAYAYDHSLIACIDEKKATRIAKAQFPGLAIISTVELFRELAKRTNSDPTLLGTMLANSCTYARMRIPNQHKLWVMSFLKEHASGVVVSS